MDTPGAPDDQVRLTTAAGQSFDASIAWTGSEYGVAWMDFRDGNFEIYFTRVSARGEEIGDDVRLTNAPDDSSWPSLVWNGGEYGVAWSDRRGGRYETYFARISAEGAIIGSEFRVSAAPPGTDDFNPSAVWTGSEYGIAWDSTRDPGDTEVYFARLDACR